MKEFLIAVSLFGMWYVIFGLSPEEVRHIVDLYTDNKQRMIPKYENYNVDEDRYVNRASSNMVPELEYLHFVQIQMKVIRVENMQLDLGGRNRITIPAVFKYFALQWGTEYSFSFYMIIKSNPEDPNLLLQRIFLDGPGERLFILQNVLHARILEHFYKEDNVDAIRAKYTNLAGQMTKIRSACADLKRVSGTKWYWVKGAEIEITNADLWLNELVKVITPGVLKCRRGVIGNNREGDNSELLSTDYYYHYVLSHDGWIKVECNNASVSMTETDGQKICAVEEYLLVVKSI